MGITSIKYLKKIILLFLISSVACKDGGERVFFRSKDGKYTATMIKTSHRSYYITLCEYEADTIPDLFIMPKFNKLDVMNPVMVFFISWNGDTCVVNTYANDVEFSIKRSPLLIYKEYCTPTSNDYVEFHRLKKLNSENYIYIDE
ncbi:MAG TPA: hypothetical protein PLH27_03180 [bacterium]|nr:hypothetical protein [bacterium]HMY34980.1 hypothetical protein [bacterium]HMZ03477.1 hypothetical protein [bacterium]HNB07996.1 hypothetical protein [bacterium]HNB56734.1 hypothetical protein [bacterium]